MKLKVFRKHMIINFYFINALKYVYEETTSDYILFLEDDQSYEPDTFSNVYTLMTKENPKRHYSKISWCQEKYCQLRGKTEFTVNCNEYFVLGAWGAMRSRSEMKTFLRWMKYARYFESEDTLSSWLCSALDKQVDVYHTSTHFGWRSMPKKNKRET